MSLLNIPENKQLSSQKYRHIKIDEIISSDHPYVLNNDATSAITHIPQWIIDWLKSEFTKDLNLSDINFPKKIYIDRGDGPNISKLRLIVNEKDVKDKLSENNYKVIKLSDYSIIDQIKLFYNAKKMVAFMEQVLQMSCLPILNLEY